MILGADMTPYYSSDDSTLNKEKKYTKDNRIYVLGKGSIKSFSTDGVGHTIDHQKMYKTNLTQPNKKFVLSLQYHGNNSYLFVNGQEELKFKTGPKEIQRIPLCLGNISSDWSLTNSTHTGLFGTVYDFAADNIPINGVKAIYDIQRYLMTKHNI